MQFISFVRISRIGFYLTTEKKGQKMALEQSDLDAIRQMIIDENAKSKGAGDGKGDDGNKKDGKDGNDDVAKIKADADAKKNAEERLKSAIAFNIGRDSFIESNKKFIPEGVATVFKAYASRNFGSEEEKADNYRKVILDEIFGDQKNIDVLPESMKSEIARYKELPESDKIKQSGKYFVVVDTFLTIKKGMAQKEFNGNGENASSAYSDRFDKLSDNFNKKG